MLEGKEVKELLEQLAERLGTTVEKLWAVLLKQASINGIVDSLILIGMVIFSIAAFRFVKKKTTKLKRTNGECPTAEWEYEIAFGAWLGVAVMFIFTILCIGILAESIVASFFNPEYWALSKILTMVK